MTPKKTGTSMLTYFLRVFLLIIVIPIFSINFMLNQKYKNVLVDNYSEKVMQVMEQIAVSYEDEQKRMSLIEAQIANDTELLELYTKWNEEDNPNLSFDLSREIDSKIKYMLNYNTNVETLVVYFREGGFYYYGNPPFKTYEEVSGYDWYKAVQSNNGKIIRIGMTDGITWSYSDAKKLAVAIKPKSLKKLDTIEAVYFEVSSNAFSTLNSDYASEGLGNILFVDAKGEIVVSADPDFGLTRIEELDYLKNIYNQKKTVIVKKLKETGEYVSAYYVPKSQGMIINLVNEDMLTKDINGILRIFNWVYVIVIVLFILFTTLFFREMIVPIRKLIKKMESVRKGNFDDTIEVKGPNEIRQLNGSYNIMISEIKNLMVERDLKENERSKEEMRALQAQINPHFVYNTLNSIRLMAMMSKAEGIKNMIDAFMKILSKTFKDIGKRVLIEEEIEYLQNYIYIMQVRYGDGFELSFQIQEEVKKLYILNMLLQPIVENAILHGFRDQQGGGVITIEGLEDHEDVILKVSDNGCGMDEETIHRVLTQYHSSTKGLNHMGVANVNKRIKLNFGNSYGLKIESILGVSTTVIVRLPKLEAQERGSEHV